MMFADRYYVKGKRLIADNLPKEPVEYVNPYMGNISHLLVPTYPTGTIGACVASDRESVSEPARPVPPEMAEKLRYYTEDVHRAAFANPAFVKKLLEA